MLADDPALAPRAADDPVEMIPELAADAVDEWFQILSSPHGDQEDPRLAVLPIDQTLHVHATDPDLAVSGDWLITRAADGVHSTSLAPMR